MMRTACYPGDDHISQLAISWSDLIKTLGILEIKAECQKARFAPVNTILLREDGSYFRVRLPNRSFERLAREWEEFQKLGREAKDAILNAIVDSREGRPNFTVRYYDEPYIENNSPLSDDEIEIEPKRVEKSGDTARILLTANKFIEEALKQYLTSTRAFVGMNFMVDVKDEEITITKLPSSMSGPAQSFSYKYSVSESDSLSVELERIKRLMDNDLTQKPILLNTAPAPGQENFD